MNKLSRPPEELNSADVIEFAHIDETMIQDPMGPYVVVDGKRLGRAKGLIIARNRYDEQDVLLFFCDEKWSVLAAAGYSTVAEAEDCAESHYRGVSTAWQPVA